MPPPSVTNSTRINQPSTTTGGESRQTNGPSPRASGAASQQGAGSGSLQALNTLRRQQRVTTPSANLRQRRASLESMASSASHDSAGSAEGSQLPMSPHMAALLAGSDGAESAAPRPPVADGTDSAQPQHNDAPPSYESLFGPGPYPEVASPSTSAQSPAQSSSPPPVPPRPVETSAAPARPQTPPPPPPPRPPAMQSRPQTPPPPVPPRPTTTQARPETPPPVPPRPTTTQARPQTPPPVPPRPTSPQARPQTPPPPVPPRPTAAQARPQTPPPAPARPPMPPIGIPPMAPGATLPAYSAPEPLPGYSQFPPEPSQNANQWASQLTVMSQFGASGPGHIDDLLQLMGGRPISDANAGRVSVAELNQADRPMVAAQAVVQLDNAMTKMDDASLSGKDMHDAIAATQHIEPVQLRAATMARLAELLKKVDTREAHQSAFKAISDQVHTLPPEARMQVLKGLGEHAFHPSFSGGPEAMRDGTANIHTVLGHLAQIPPEARSPRETAVALDVMIGWMPNLMSETPASHWQPVMDSLMKEAGKLPESESGLIKNTVATIAGHMQPGGALHGMGVLHPNDLQNMLLVVPDHLKPHAHSDDE